MISIDNQQRMNNKIERENKQSNYDIIARSEFGDRRTWPIGEVVKSGYEHVQL